MAVAKTGISFFADVIGHSGEFQCVPSATTTPVAAFTSFARATSKARKATLLLFSVAVLLAGGAATVRGQSARDGFDPNANGAVRVVVVQPDGKILIGGEFTTLSPNGGGPVTRNYIARLNPDGTLDLAFNPNANGPVESIAVQADGKILAGGTFTTIGGQPRNYIARLDATTGSADSFNPNASNEVRSIAVQADGKILAGGISQLSAERRATASPGSMPSPDWLTRSTRTRTVMWRQSWCRRTARFWWAAISTERTASADKHATASPGSMPRPDWLIRSTRTRTVMSMQSRCRRTARF